MVELSGQYSALLSAVLLHKGVRCQLWECSALAARQLPRIGPVLAALLSAAGKTSLRAVAQANARDLERVRTWVRVHLSSSCNSPGFRQNSRSSEGNLL